MRDGGCYAERMAARFAGPGQPYEGTITDGRWNGHIRTVEECLEDPIRWRKPRLIFINSMSDLFHEAIPDEYIWRVFEMMAIAHGKNGHVFLLLTKRWNRMMEFSLKAQEAQEAALREGRMAAQWPPRGVWWGHSIWDQPSANGSIPLLLRTSAALRFVSVEPMLGPVDLSRYLFSSGPDGEPAPRNDPPLPCLSWVICGCESGPNARPMGIEWVRSLRDQCVEADVAFYLKQAAFGCRIIKMPELDGRVWDQMPGDVVS